MCFTDLQLLMCSENRRNDFYDMLIDRLSWRKWRGRIRWSMRSRMMKKVSDQLRAVMYLYKIWKLRTVFIDVFSCTKKLNRLPHILFPSLFILISLLHRQMLQLLTSLSLFTFQINISPLKHFNRAAMISQLIDLVDSNWWFKICYLNIFRPLIRESDIAQVNHIKQLNKKKTQRSQSSQHRETHLH